MAPMSKFDRQTERMLESQARQRGITVDELLAEGDRFAEENPGVLAALVPRRNIVFSELVPVGTVFAVSTGRDPETDEPKLSAVKLEGLGSDFTRYSP